MHDFLCIIFGALCHPGRETPPVEQIGSAIPEPGAALLFAAGLLVLAWRTRA